MMVVDISNIPVMWYIVAVYIREVPQATCKITIFQLGTQAWTWFEGANMGGSLDRLFCDASRQGHMMALLGFTSSHSLWLHDETS